MFSSVNVSRDIRPNGRYHDLSLSNLVSQVRGQTGTVSTGTLDTLSSLGRNPGVSKGADRNENGYGYISPSVKADCLLAIKLGGTAGNDSRPIVGAGYFFEGENGEG